MTSLLLLYPTPKEAVPFLTLMHKRGLLQHQTRELERLLTAAKLPLTSFLDSFRKEQEEERGHQEGIEPEIIASPLRFTLHHYDITLIICGMGLFNPIITLSTNLQYPLNPPPALPSHHDAPLFDQLLLLGIAGLFNPQAIDPQAIDQEQPQVSTKLLDQDKQRIGHHFFAKELLFLPACLDEQLPPRLYPAIKLDPPCFLSPLTHASAAKKQECTIMKEEIEAADKLALEARLAVTSPSPLHTPSSPQISPNNLVLHHHQGNQGGPIKEEMLIEMEGYGLIGAAKRARLASSYAMLKSVSDLCHQRGDGHHIAARIENLARRQALLLEKLLVAGP